MMLRVVAFSLLTISTLVAGLPSQAALIVDTGEGTGSAVAVGDLQWVAGEFTLDRDIFITRIEGWMLTSAPGLNFAGQNFSISVWGDGGDVPDVTDRRYTNSVTVVGDPGEAFSWEGYDITWGGGLELAAGSYWASFEYRPVNGNDYIGGIGSLPPNPLANYAVLTNAWAPANFTFAMRVNGTPVPIPAPVTLLGIGWVVMTVSAGKRSA